MFTMLILLLAGIGTAALARIIIHMGYMAARWLFGKIQTFIQERVGNKVFLCGVEDVVTGLKEEAQKTGNVARIDDILAQLDGKKGVLQGNFTADENLVDVKILTADEVDPQINDVMNKYQNRHVVLS